MDRLIESLPLLLAPFIACLVIASLHCYLGLHVIKRGVIFVDLALAQSAALGAAVALFLGPWLLPEGHEHGGTSGAAIVAEADLAEQLAAENEPTEGATRADVRDTRATPLNHATHAHHALEPDGSSGKSDDEHRWFGQSLALSFALLGAVLLALGRLRDARIPHEAIIGIIFVVFAALSVLVLSRAPHGHEKMEAMLVGSILFVTWPQVGVMATLYAALGLLHFGFRRAFIQITNDVTVAEQAGRRVRLWDCLFYGSFALMVTQSVALAGVFVVFSFLIIPAACAVLFARTFGRQLPVAWGVAALTTAAGLIVSAAGDLPTGPSLVSCFGTALVVCLIIRKALGRRNVGVA